MLTERQIKKSFITGGCDFVGMAWTKEHAAKDGALAFSPAERKKEQKMNLSDYFEKTEGLGILATADAAGKVNAALYGRPHFFTEDTVAFIAAERLTYKNLQSNPHAVYLFKEAGGYRGHRLYLTKISEEQDSPLIEEIRRKKFNDVEGRHKKDHKYLLCFHVDNILPLIGGGGEN